METDFIQCSPNVSKRRKEILQKANKKNSDVMLLIAYVPVSSALLVCDCVE